MSDTPHQSLLAPEANKFHVGNGDDGKQPLDARYWALRATVEELVFDPIRRGGRTEGEILNQLKMMSEEHYAKPNCYTGSAATNIVKLKRKPRPLRKTYQPNAPYAVERGDDDYSIRYEVIDERPETYRIVCFVDDDEGRSGYAKHDAEQIARGLNLLVQYGKETLPNVKERDDD